METYAVLAYAVVSARQTKTAGVIFDFKIQPLTEIEYFSRDKLRGDRITTTLLTIGRAR
jgi:hypothetical protein